MDFFFVCLVCIQVCVFSHSVKDDFFLKKNSYLVPCRVIKFVWCQTPVTFDDAWYSCVTLYKKVYTFLTTKSQLCSFVEHCRYLHKHFFSHLYIDTRDYSLVYTQQDASVYDLGQSMVNPVFHYWLQNKNQAAFDFYALYFDCVVTLFLDAISSAEKSNNIQLIYEKIESYYGELLSLHVRLKGSVYEQRYAQQLQRYQELVASVGAGL